MKFVENITVFDGVSGAHIHAEIKLSTAQIATLRTFRDKPIYLNSFCISVEFIYCLKMMSYKIGV